MAHKLLVKAGLPFRRLARRVKRNIDGVAAVEFGMLAPVMVLMLIGTVEISRAVWIDRRFGVVTAMTGDLIAREKTIDDSALRGIMDVIAHVMRPHDPSGLKLGVIAVKAASGNAADTRVEWSFAHNGKSVPARCANYSLPTGLVAAGGSVIIVETSYEFQPLFANLLMQSLTWTDKSTHSPRNSCVDYNGTNCVLTCP